MPGRDHSVAGWLRCFGVGLFRCLTSHTESDHLVLLNLGVGAVMFPVLSVAAVYGAVNHADVRRDSLIGSAVFAACALATAIGVTWVSHARGFCDPDRRRR